MKKSLQKKLKNYSLTAGAMIAAGVSADAQVQYSGEINHSMVTNDTYNIDLDGDGVDDFEMQLNTYYSSSSFSGDIDRLVDGNNWMGTGFASALSSGVAVNSSSAIDWEPSDNNWDLGFFYPGGSSVSGNFPGAGDKFIGVKFDISGTTHYGWIRVNLAADAQSMTIVDWAYNQTAGAEILTGDIGGATPPTCSGINVDNISQTSSDVHVTPGADGDLYYVLVLETDAAPTATEVIAGTGSGGATAITAGSMAVTNGNEATVNITGLTANINYTAYLVLDDGVVKTLSTVYDTDFSTLATIPGCSGISVNNISQTSSDIHATPDADGNLYHVILLETDAAPTATEVIAGTGSGGVTAITAGNMVVISGNEATINLTGLTLNTNYTAYLVLDDGVVKTLSAVYDTDFSTLNIGVTKLNADNLNISPNPSTGVVKIDYNTNQNLNIIINDITGRVVLQKTINSFNNSIDLSSYGKGIYNIKINNGISIVNKKIIIN